MTIGNGDVLIAAITSCTNTSNPSVLLAAGLLAKKAVEAGLTVQPHIKTSLAPGSRIVTEYLTKAGLLPYLEKLGFNARGLRLHDLHRQRRRPDAGAERRDHEERPRLRRGAFGQPQLRGAHPPEPEGQLPGQRRRWSSPTRSPATCMRDLMTEPVGKGKGGKDVYLGDIWPTSDEIDGAHEVRDERQGLPQANYDKVTSEPGDAVEKIKGVQRAGLRLAEVDLHRRAAVLRRLRDAAARRPSIGVKGARAHGALRRLDHDRPHLAGRLDQGKLAGRHVAEGERRVEGRLQQLRLAPRQPRRDDARHLRQRAHQEPDDPARRQTARARKAA